MPAAPPRTQARRASPPRLGVRRRARRRARPQPRGALTAAGAAVTAATARRTPSAAGRAPQARRAAPPASAADGRRCPATPRARAGARSDDARTGRARRRRSRRGAARRRRRRSATGCGGPTHRRSAAGRANGVSGGGPRPAAARRHGACGRRRRASRHPPVARALRGGGERRHRCGRRHGRWGVVRAPAGARSSASVRLICGNDDGTSCAGARRERRSAFAARLVERRRSRGECPSSRTNVSSSVRRPSASDGSRETPRGGSVFGEEVRRDVARQVAEDLVDGRGAPGAGARSRAPRFESRVALGWLEQRPSPARRRTCPTPAAPTPRGRTRRRDQRWPRRRRRGGRRRGREPYAAVLPRHARYAGPARRRRTTGRSARIGSCEDPASAPRRDGTAERLATGGGMLDVDGLGSCRTTPAPSRAPRALRSRAQPRAGWRPSPPR